MAEKRKRGQNYTAEEKDRLLKLLSYNKETILNKKTDGCTNEAKSRAWLEITKAFNSCSNVQRSKDSLLKLWEKIKTETKIYSQLSQRNEIETVNPFLERACNLLGWACSGLIDVQDSDTDIDNVPNIEILGFDLDPLEASTMIEPCEDKSGVKRKCLDAHDEDISQENYSISKSPLWSKRSQHLPQNDERFEAVKTLCTSIQGVNKKKEDVAELKRQLLLDEMEFKRKLYRLQLQAAEKDVEIKTEILHQMRSKELEVQEDKSIQIVISK